METHRRLEEALREMDGRSYPEYRRIRGEWEMGDWCLSVDHVQGDPYAAPSRVRAWVCTGIDSEVARDAASRMAAEDWLLRRFAIGCRGSRRGSGRSGEMTVYEPGPEIVRRSAVRLLGDGRAEIRFRVGLPGRGRRISAKGAMGLFLRDIPAALDALRDVGSQSSLQERIESVKTQRALREQLDSSGLVAFVANGSILPRSSGVSQEPLEGAVPFQSPAGLEVTLDTPSGPVSGMGIPTGVSLIVGGGFHGKSTLLDALQRGHMDHEPGDGRERVVSIANTVKVRAEDGRNVSGVDISSFLDTLPGGTGTCPFHSSDASGSTSQAASIIEALEAGVQLLLLDEDTSATNLLVRDSRMRALVPSNMEPITPLVDRIRQMVGQAGVSTVMVVGGVGDYLSVADTVIAMVNWEPVDVTARARSLAGPAPVPKTGFAFRRRLLTRDGLRPTGKGRIRARDQHRFEYGREEVDLSGVEQVLDSAAAITVGHAIRVLWESMPEEEGVLENLLDGIDTILEAEGIDVLSPHSTPVGGLVWPRRHEVAAAINRLRSLEARLLEG